MGTISVIGIIVMQIYWVRKAFDINDTQFNQTITIALRNVAEKISGFNHSELPADNPVNQLASDYYVVNVNTKIDANLLEYYLKTEFADLNLNTDYEYAIYDCASNKMMYGNYISVAHPETKMKLSHTLPKYDKFTYYFGVYLPNKSSLLANRMDIWIFSSFMLLIVIFFFGYALTVILKQYRLSEVQKDFVNNMTHEFKTPLSTIAISADVLSKPDIINSPENLSTYAGIIKAENTRLIKQVEKVLQMTHLDKNKLELHKESVDIKELAETTVMHIKMALPESKTAEITLNCNADDLIVQADKLHLNNILLNLLDNAVKYSKERPVINIQISNKNHALQLVVADKGIGIMKEYQKKVFDKFFRVPTGNIHNVKGFGLGLNYVKKIVDVHGWAIKLESVYGQGSTFIISIPQMVKKNGK